MIEFISNSYTNSLAFLFIRFLMISSELDMDNNILKIILQIDIKKEISELQEKLKNGRNRIKPNSVKDTDHLMNMLRNLFNTLSYALKGEWTISRGQKIKKLVGILDITYNKDNTKTKTKNSRSNEYVKKIEYEEFAKISYNIYKENNITDLNLSLLFLSFLEINDLEIIDTHYNIDNDKKHKKLNSNYFTEESFKKREIKIRLFQTKFRKNVFNTNKHICIICNTLIKEILDACHILDVKDVENNVDYWNGFNGLIMCKNHHYLFDNNFFEITENGEIKINNNLDYDILKILNKKITLKPEQIHYIKLKKAKC